MDLLGLKHLYHDLHKFRSRLSHSRRLLQILDNELVQSLILKAAQVGTTGTLVAIPDWRRGIQTMPRIKATRAAVMLSKNPTILKERTSLLAITILVKPSLLTTKLRSHCPMMLFLLPAQL